MQPRIQQHVRKLVAVVAKVTFPQPFERQIVMVRVPVTAHVALCCRIRPREKRNADYALPVIL